MRWSFSGFDIMSVAWWILKEIPTHSTNTALFSAVLLVEKFTRTLEIIIQPRKMLYFACVWEVCKDQEVSQSSAFLMLFFMSRMELLKFWHYDLHLQYELIVCVLYVKSYSSLTAVVLLRDLISCLAVRRQPGDHSLQSSGSCLQETASIHFPRGQRHCVC